MATIKKIKKAQSGVKQEWYNPRDKDSTTRRTVVADTSGYSAGAKKFPTKTTTSKGTFPGTTSRKQVDKMIKNPRMGAFGVKAKKGGSFDLNKDGKTTFKDVLIGRGVLPKTAKKGMKVKRAQAGTSLDSAAARKYGVEPFDMDTEKATKRGYETTGKTYPGNEAMYKTISERRSKRLSDEKTRLSNKGKVGYDKMGFPIKKNKTGGMTAKKKLNMGGMMKKGGKMTKKCAYGCK